MTSTPRDLETSNRSADGRLRSHVLASVPTHSRRDLIRATAVVAAAAGLGTPPAGIRAQPSSRMGQTVRAQNAAEVTIPFIPFGQVISLDPHRAPNWGPFWVLMPHVWAGLLAFDENGAVEADLAESVEPNDAGDVWTATLRPDLAFASGNPVTAQSFVDSWLRALDPLQPAPMSSFMEKVSGYAAYIAGESSEIGFRVVDDQTIEIALSEPDSSFPAALATFGWAAIDLTVLGDPDIADPLLSGAGAGLWQFTEFVDGDHIAMEPNPNSVRPASPAISRVTWAILEGPTATQDALERYRDDEFAVADITGSLFADASSDGTLATELVTIESQASTMAIGMDFNQAPFDDVRVRQAIAAAIDRETWATETWAGEFVPATSIVPPVVTITADYEPATAIAFDPHQASSLLADAGIDPETNMPDIVYYQPATDSPVQIDRHATLLAQVESATGLVIRHDVTLTADQIAALQADNGGRQFDIVWWWTATDTPALLQTVGHSSSPYMAGWFNWSPDLEGVNEGDAAQASAQFDDLILAANGTVDQAQRNDAFARAESLLLENAVYVPLGHWVQRYVQKPWLQGTRQGPWSGGIPVRFDADVTIGELPTG